MGSGFVTNPTTPGVIAAETGGRFAPLDGVRAAAVLVVVAYHAVEPHRFGGYVGVDVFFALSGFLITTLLLRELDRFGEIGWVASTRDGSCGSTRHCWHYSASCSCQGWCSHRPR